MTAQERRKINKIILTNLREELTMKRRGRVTKVFYRGVHIETLSPQRKKIVKHTKGCELGDNYKDCPACTEG